MPHHAPMDHNASIRKKLKEYIQGKDDYLLERNHQRKLHYYNDMTHRNSSIWEINSMEVREDISFSNFFL